MAVKDLDIWRSAKLLIGRDPATAHNEAIERAKEARKVSDTETEAVWLRIAKAITELRVP
jgi:hypothetical protein